MSYQGLKVEVPLGTEGYTGTYNLSQVAPGYLSEAQNICFSEGLLRKEGGAAKYNASAISGAPTILGGWDHRTNALAQRMIVAASDGKLYKDSGSGTFSVTLKSGLSASMRPFFVEGGKEAAAGNRKLFVFTGTNVVQVLADDGATTADIATPPADWSGSNQPTFGFIHANRLIGAGNANDPHRAYISSLTNHEDFSGATTFAIYPGEGEALVGGISFNNYAIFWKRPLGIYALDMRDANSANWTVQKVTRAVGLASPWAFAQTDSDVIFMDCTGGIQSLTYSMSNADIEGRNLGQESLVDNSIRALIKQSRIDTTRAVYYVAKRELHFALTSSAASVNDTRLVLDFYRPDKIRYRISQRDTCESLWLRRDTNGVQRLVSGDNAGFVWLLDQDTRSKDGAAYMGRAVTVPTDFGFAEPSWADRKKNAAFLELVFQPSNTNSVNVTLTWDNSFSQTVTFTPQNRGTPLGSFVLGTSMLGGSQFATLTKRLVGGGKFVTLTFENNVVGEDFAIGRARLYFTLGSD